MKGHPKDMDSDDPAIACNLAPADYRRRLEWIERLNVTALCDQHRKGSAVELTYDRAAAARVRQFVRAEQECRPLLDFSIREDETTLVVTIQTPEDADVTP